MQTSISEQNKNVSSRLIPVTDWSKYHSWPPLGGLRYLIFHADKNGFGVAIRRVGKRILISESDFFEWVEKQNQTAKEGI